VGGRGSAPDTAGGAYSTLQYALARFRALLLKGREGGRDKGQGGVERGRRREGKWYLPTFREKVTPLTNTSVNSAMFLAK